MNLKQGWYDFSSRNIPNRKVTTMTTAQLFQSAIDHAGDFSQPVIRKRLRAIIYCRVSTDKQEQDGESLDYQEQKCRKYAELNDIEVIAILREARSGYIHYSLREKLTIARQYIKDGLADMIIVWDLRRFSRNFVHSAMIFEEIESAGGTIVSVSENIDDSLTGRLIRAILAWGAESERAKILEYANRHWQARLEAGLPVATSYPPYGWAWGDEDKTYYVISPEEATVRFSIFHMFVELNMSLRAIAHKLTENGVLTPTLTRNTHEKPTAKITPEEQERITWRGEFLRDGESWTLYSFTSRGLFWTPTTLYDFLKDTKSIGTLTICKKKNTLDERGRLKREPHPQQKIIPNGLPAIVSPLLFERAQRKLKINQIEQSHPPKDPTRFLLKGHVQCGTCGNRMCTHILERKGHEYPYYYCSNRRNKYGQCPDIPYVRADLVDTLVWAECCRMFVRLEVIQARIEQEIEQAVSTLLEGTTGREQMIALQAEIAYAKQECKKYDQGSYTYNLISQDIQAKEEQLARYEEECASSGSIAQATALYQQRCLEFLTFLNVMRGRYEEASFQEIRNALEVLGVIVVIADLPRGEHLRGRGHETTLENLWPRLTITYSPLFAGTGIETGAERKSVAGVHSSGDGRPQNQ